MTGSGAPASAPQSWWYVLGPGKMKAHTLGFTVINPKLTSVNQLLVKQLISFWFWHGNCLIYILITTQISYTSFDKCSRN